MGLNTTETMRKASTVQAPDIENTVKNTKKMMAKIGIANYKTVKCRIVKTLGSGDDVAFAGLNGEKFYYKRGESYEIPTQVAAILEGNGDI